MDIQIIFIECVEACIAEVCAAPAQSVPGTATVPHLQTHVQSGINAIEQYIDV